MMKKITLSLFLLIFCFNTHFAQQIDEEFIKQHTFYNLERALKNPEEVYSLDLREQNLTAFPLEILKLTNLRTLNLSVNKITEIPNEISKLTNLTTFKLYNNNLSTLPESIGNLANLKELDCDLNLLGTLPESIGNLKNLNKFSCSVNKLGNLPESIGNLVNLNDLDCSKNLLITLPESIGNLVNLNELNCSKNLLTTLPESIGNLGNLKVLGCNINLLTTLPKTIGNLGNLTNFYCSENRLSNLPESLVNLQKLKAFNCYGNPFKTIPVSLKDFLSKLDYAESESIRSILGVSDKEDVQGVVEVEAVKEEEPDQDVIFTVVEIQPEFKGGMMEFYKYLQKNLRYPEEADRVGIQGKVFIQFVVDSVGTLSEIKVVKGIGGGCDEEAIRLIKESPLWEPGKQRGRPVRVKMVTPIIFKLK